MGKRPQPRLRIDALTGEWRNKEAGERRGSDLKPQTYIPSLCLSTMPFSRGHITLYREAGNRDVLGSIWVL